MGSRATSGSLGLPEIWGHSPFPREEDGPGLFRKSLSVGFMAGSSGVASHLRIPGGHDIPHIRRPGAFFLCNRELSLIRRGSFHY